MTATTNLIFNVTFTFIMCNVFAQLDGEFWWLNDKITKLRGVEAPTVKFEDVGEFDNDESDVIVFKDNLLDNSSQSYKDFNISKDSITKENETQHLENSLINVNPETVQVNNKQNTTKYGALINHTINDFEKYYNKIYNFPVDNSQKIFYSNPFPIIWPTDTIVEENTKLSIKNNNTKIKENDQRNNSFALKDMVNNTFEPSNNKIDINTDTEHICTYISQELCTEQKGIIYQYLTR